jgi:hypothetical protein
MSFWTGKRVTVTGGAGFLGSLVMGAQLMEVGRQVGVKTVEWYRSTWSASALPQPLRPSG